MYVRVKNNCLDEYDPWADILAATSFVVQSTYHTTLQAIPCQLVCMHGILLNTPLIDNC